MDKLMVWNQISNFLDANSRENVFLGGYFNAILNLEEKVGGFKSISQVRLDFNNWFANNNLIDLPTFDGIYLWNNRRVGFSQIAERLDRFFFKGTWDFLTNPSNLKPLSSQDLITTQLD